MSERDGRRSGTRMDAALLDALLQQPHMAVGVCDAHGVLQMMSPAMERLLGLAYRPSSRPVWERSYHLYDEQGRCLPRHATPLARTVRGEQVTDQVVSVRRPGMPVRWGLANGFQLRGDGGEPIGAAVFVLDITARAEEIRRLDDLRDQLVDTVNHEVRTPVAKIQGHIELLEDSAESLPESARWSVAAIHRATDRLVEVAATISHLAEQSQGLRRQR